MNPQILVSTPSATCLEVENLCFSYPHCRLFENWSACIGPGLTLLRGDEGSGKTSLLRLLAGELPAQSGQLRINGASLHKNPDAYRASLFWVDPREDAFDAISALDFFKLQAGRYPGFDTPLALELADALALGPHLHKPTYMLSTGSRRKVWLAAGFASGAALTLLDDPFAALDQPSVRVVMDLLADASAHTTRAWLMAHYEPPGECPLAQLIELAPRQA
jgi:ABC-type multidrug transport system ATPase subunit